MNEQSGRPVTNVAASVRQRLLNLSKVRHDDFNRLLTQYALERLLYRISRSPYSETLATQFRFEEERLADALVATFARRNNASAEGNAYRAFRGLLEQPGKTNPMAKFPCAECFVRTTDADIAGGDRIYNSFFAAGLAGTESRKHAASRVGSR